MAWKLLSKPKTVLVTKKLATQFAEMDPAPHDRPLSERRLMVYRRIRKEGGFRPVTWASALCTETGGLYRVNGKHTSTMLAGEDEPLNFYAIIEEYECDTLEDVAKLYATFDSSIQSRSARDIYLSFAATVPELKALPSAHISVAVSGMAMHTKGHSADGREQAADRAELLLEHPEFVIWMSGIFSAGEESQSGRDGRRHSRHLMRQPVVAAMMGCWQKSRAAATEFWTLVRDQSGHPHTTPDRKLSTYLLTTGVDTGGGSRKLRPVPAREMYGKCIHAWNAWRKKEDTNLRYYPDKELPSFR